MTSRRAPGSGSIYQRSRDGRWCAAIDTGEVPRRRKTVTALTRERLIERLDEIGVDLDAERLPAGRMNNMARARALGTHTAEEWHAIVRSSPKECPHCSVPLNTFNRTKDHKIPVSRGGSDLAENLQPICWECNAEKGAMTDQEFTYEGPRPRGFSPQPRSRKEYERALAYKASRLRLRLGVSEIF